MARYYKDSAEIIHVVDENSAGSEFTLCGYAYDACDIRDSVKNGAMVYFDGPCNCLCCKEAVTRIRGMLKGVKFARTLVDS